MATVLTESEGALDPEYEKRIADYVAATGEPIMIDDVRSTRDPLALGASMACVPLVLQDRMLERSRSLINLVRWVGREGDLALMTLICSLRYQVRLLQK